MVRTQISLTEKQAKLLKELALSEGMSQSAIIRRALDLLLQDKKLTLRIEHARAAVGAYSSECSSTALEHDSELKRIFGA